MLYSFPFLFREFILERAAICDFGYLPPAALMVLDPCLGQSYSLLWNMSLKTDTESSRWCWVTDANKTRPSSVQSYCHEGPYLLPILIDRGLPMCLAWDEATGSKSTNMPAPTGSIVVGFPFRHVQTELQKSRNWKAKRKTVWSKRNQANQQETLQPLERDWEILIHIVSMGSSHASTTTSITFVAAVTSWPVLSTYDVPSTRLMSWYVVNSLSSLMIQVPHYFHFICAGIEALRWEVSYFRTPASQWHERDLK